MRSLYSKFVIFTVLTMVGSGLIAFLIVNTYYHQFLKSENDAKNMYILQEMTTYIEQHPTLDVDAFLTMQAKAGYKLYLVHEDGGLASNMYGEPFRSFHIEDGTIEQVLAGTSYHGMRDLPKETFVTGFFADELANTVGHSFTFQGTTYALFLRPNIKLLFSEVHYLLGGLLIGMGAISLLAMIFVARQLIKPLRQLTVATEKISAGEFDIPVSPTSQDEIGQLTESFATMADKLQKADTMQKQFITDVSHDLQTPLQQIKGYAALLKDEELPHHEKEHFIYIIEREADRLSNLSRQLLTLTSLDMERSFERVTTFRVDSQLKQLLQRFRWQLEQKNLTVTADLAQATMEGFEPLIEQLWENVLSNAIKYTPEGRAIAISLQTDQEQLIFTITDEGIGIDEAHLPYLFDRFYRVDEARSSEVEGTGLGLAIVKKIIELHNGRIKVDSSLGKGTTMTIIFHQKRL